MSHEHDYENTSTIVLKKKYCYIKPWITASLVNTGLSKTVPPPYGTLQDIARCLRHSFWTEVPLNSLLLVVTLRLGRKYK